MRNYTGFIVQMPKDRIQKLSDQSDGIFAEPVPEFQVTENKNFICFIVSEGNILMLAEGTRGYSGGTDLRQIDLNCVTIFALQNPVDLNFVISGISKKLKRYAETAVNDHKIIPPSTLKEFVEVLSGMDPKVKDVIDRYQKKDVTNFLEGLSESQHKDLAFQKSAISDALFLTDIDRSELEEWEVPQNVGNKPISYLSGLKSVRLRETDMIHRDLHNLPGFEIIEKTSFESTVFDNGRVKLTVLLTDKKPLEEDMGVDLIYYNETYKAFVMVQYKAMELDTSGPIYRLPSKQLQKEILAMDTILEKIKISKPTTIHDFRLFYNPFFLKLCSRLDFDPDSAEMAPGMYFPLDYWKILENDDLINGPRGGKGVTYENAHKKFNNTDFRSLLVNGWIGTDTTNSEYLQEVIKEAVQSGKRVIYAIADKSEAQDYDL